MASQGTPLFDETSQTTHEQKDLGQGGLRAGIRSKEKRHTSLKWTFLLGACPGSARAHRKKEKGTIWEPKQITKKKNGL